MKARIAFQSPEQNVRWPQNFSLRAGIRADKQNFIIRGNSHGFCFARRFFSWAGHALDFGPSKIDEGQSPPQMKETKIAFLILCVQIGRSRKQEHQFLHLDLQVKQIKNERLWKSSFGFCSANQHIKHGFLHFCLARVFPATFLNFGHQAALQFEQLVDAKYRNPSHSEISVFFFQNGESKHCFCFYGQNRKNYFKKRCFQSKESMILEISP